MKINSNMKTSLSKLRMGAFLAALLATSISSGRATVLLDQNFNSGTAGIPVASPWQVVVLDSPSTGNATYSAVTETGSGLSAELLKGGVAPGYRQSYHQALSSTFDMGGTGTLNVQFSIRLEQTTNQVSVRLIDAGLIYTPFSLNFLDDTGINHGVFAGGVYAIGIWYDVNLTLNAATDTFSYELRRFSDNALIASATNYAAIDVGAFNPSVFQVMMISDGDPATATAFLDNVLVQAVVPEPSTVAMMAFGLAGMVGLRHFRRMRCRTL